MSAEDPGDINVDDLDLGDIGDSGVDADVDISGGEDPGDIRVDVDDAGGEPTDDGIDAGGFGEELGGDPAGDAGRDTGAGADPAPEPDPGPSQPPGGGLETIEDPAPPPDPVAGEPVNRGQPPGAGPETIEDPEPTRGVEFAGSGVAWRARQFEQQVEEQTGLGSEDIRIRRDGDTLRAELTESGREIQAARMRGAIGGLLADPAGFDRGQLVSRPAGGFGTVRGGPPLGDDFELTEETELPPDPGFEPGPRGQRHRFDTGPTPLEEFERATRPGERPPPDLLDDIDPEVVEGLSDGDPFRVRLQEDPIGTILQVVDDPVDILEGGAFTEAEERQLREGGLFGLPLPGSEDFDRFQDRFEENEPLTVPELGTAEATLVQDIAPAVLPPGSGGLVTPALARFGGSDAPERLIQGQAQTGVAVLNVPQLALTAESALEATANLGETVEEEGPLPVLGAAAAGAGLVATEAIRGAREDPVGAAGQLGAGGAIGFGAGTAIERVGGVGRTFSVARQAARRGDPGIDFRDITSARGRRGQLPEFETPPEAPTAQAVAEVRERAADQPPDVLEALGEEGVLFQSTRSELPEELVLRRGRSELPGGFTSPDASPLRLDESLGETIGSLRPRLPRPSRGEDRLVLFPGGRIEGMPPGATGSGRIFDPETGDFVPDPTTSGARFLDEVAEAETAFVRPQGGRTTELEAIFPPGSQFRRGGMARVDLPSGRSIPGPVFQRAPNLDAGDVENIDVGERAGTSNIEDIPDRLPGESRPFASVPPGGPAPPTGPDIGEPSTPDVTNRPGATNSIPPPEPTAIDPTPTDPTMTEPVSPGEPSFTDSIDTGAPTDPGPTGTITGGPTRGTPTGTDPNAPGPSDPTPTDPTPTEPTPTDPTPPTTPPPNTPPPNTPPPNTPPPNTPPPNTPPPNTPPPNTPPPNTPPPNTPPPPPSVLEPERDDERRRFDFGLGRGFNRRFEFDVLTPEEALEGLDPDPAEVDPDPAARELSSSVDPAPTVTNVEGELPSGTERALQHLTDPNWAEE